MATIPPPAGQGTALAWMVTALQGERKHMLEKLEDRHRDVQRETREGLEERHREILKTFEDHLDALSRVAAAADGLQGRAKSPGWISNHSGSTGLPGVVDGGSPPPGFVSHQVRPVSPDKKATFEEGLNKAKEDAEVKVTSPKEMGATNSRKSNFAVVDGGKREIMTGGVLGFFEGVVKATWFEMFFSGLIMGNTLVMAFEAQYQGMSVGHAIEYHGYYLRAVDSWPGAREAFEGLEWFFGIIFTLELCLKIVGLRTEFINDIWNFIDSVIVVSWCLTAADAVTLPVDPMMLRLCRLARLLRLLRLVRTIKGFDKLYLMTTAMKGSLGVLAWSVCLLGLVQSMMALFLQAMLEPYMLDTDPEFAAGRQEVYKFYGTFARSMLTMFEITLGNWLPPCRALVENVDEWYMLFSLGHKFLIGFSVVAVLNGVFIQETFKVATMDDKVMVMQKERAAKAHASKMHELFKHADTSGDGELEREEFVTALQIPEIKQWLSAMELDVNDPGAIFDLVDIDGDGTLTAHELVKGAGRLKGAARSIDVVTMMREQKDLRGGLEEVKKALLQMSRSQRSSPDRATPERSGPERPGQPLNRAAGYS